MPKEAMKQLYYCAILCSLFCTCLQAQTYPPAPIVDTTYAAFRDDIITEVLRLPDGGYLIAGDSDSPDNLGIKTSPRIDHRDIWLLRLDATRQIVWDKTFGGVGYDGRASVVQLPDGGFLVAGSADYGGFDVSEYYGRYDYWVFRLDANGNKLWDKAYGGLSFDYLAQLEPTSDNGFLLIGSSFSSGGNRTSESKGADDIWIVKIDEAGNKLWEKVIGGTSREFDVKVTRTHDGNLLLGTTSWSGVGEDRTVENKGFYDYWIVKIDENANIIWDKAFGGGEDDYLNDVIATSDGGYLIGGWSFSEDDGDKSEKNRGEYDYWVVKTDAQGNKLWDRSFGGEAEDYLQVMAESPSGGYLLGGSSFSEKSSFKNDSLKGAWLVKINEKGDKIWDKCYERQSVSKSIGGRIRVLSQMPDGKLLLGGSLFKDYWLAILEEEPVNPYSVSGKVFQDENLNCRFDHQDTPIEGWTIELKSDANTFRTTTNAQGEYTVYGDVGTYNITQIPPPNYQVNNVCSSINKVVFEEPGTEVKDLNFGINAKPCAVLQVDISANRRLRCFRGNTYISYRNRGATAAEGSFIEVQLPEFTIPISSTVPWTSFDENTRLMTFALGTIEAGFHGQIILTDSIACVDEAFNQTQCTEARIFPKNTCVPPDPNWNQANLLVEGRCILLFDPITVFTIYNRGVGDMDQAKAYRIFSDNTLLYEGTVRLIGGDSLSLQVPTQGKSMRIEVEQVAFHPENRQVSASVEGCGKANTQISKGLVNQFPQNDDNFDVEVNCLQVVGSYDPNDKLVSPEGFTDNHYVAPGTRMEYTVRFQNTGTFMAFTVVVVDTLSADLDFASFEMLSASHNYTLDVQTLEEGQNILTWTFANINLPDSTSNEPESHGYIKFKISPQATMAEGTQVENFADIFFDFNAPIRTNTTLTTFENYIFPTPPTPIDPCTLVSSAKVNSPLDITLCDTEPLPELRAETPLGGKGEWVVMQGNAEFTTPNASTTALRQLGLGETIIRWQISPALCTDNFQDIRIVRNASPAQPTIQNPADSTLRSSITGDAYNWYLDGALLDHHERSLKASTPGAYSVEVITNGCISGLSTVFQVTGCSFLSPAEVGAAQGICAREAQLSATLPDIGTGRWALVQGTGEITDPLDAQSRVTNLGIGENIFRWQVSSERCSTNYQEMKITVNPTPNTPEIVNTNIDSLQSTVIGERYRWYLDGEELPGVNVRTFRALASGTYQVVVEQDGCVSALSAGFVLEVTSLETTLVEVYGFKIHPNPAVEALNIRFKRLPAGRLSLSLKASHGATLQEIQLQGTVNQAWKSTFAISHLPKGMYLLEVKTEIGTFTKKVFKH